MYYIYPQAIGKAIPEIQKKIENPASRVTSSFEVLFFNVAMYNEWSTNTKVHMQKVRGDLHRAHESSTGGVELREVIDEQSGKFAVEIVKSPARHPPHHAATYRPLTPPHALTFTHTHAHTHTLFRRCFLYDSRIRKTNRFLILPTLFLISLNYILLLSLSHYHYIY